MNGITLEKCKWCNGAGTEDNHLPCPDCEGTGYKYGRAAADEHERQILEEFRKTLEIKQ